MVVFMAKYGSIISFLLVVLVVRGCLIVAPTIPFGESYLKYITLYHTFAPILTTTMSNGLI